MAAGTAVRPIRTDFPDARAAPRSRRRRSRSGSAARTATRGCARSGGKTRARRFASSKPDTRVEQRIDNIDQDIHDDDEASCNEEDPQQQIEIAREQRPECEEPDARPAEYRLDDDR